MSASIQRAARSICSGCGGGPTPRGKPKAAAAAHPAPKADDEDRSFDPSSAPID